MLVARQEADAKMFFFSAPFFVGKVVREADYELSAHSDLQGLDRLFDIGNGVALSQHELVGLRDSLTILFETFDLDPYHVTVFGSPTSLQGSPGPILFLEPLQHLLKLLVQALDGRTFHLEATQPGDVEFRANVE